MKPTEIELKILLLMWDLGACSVSTIHDDLVISKGVGYTSMRKLMQNMHDKVLLSRYENTRSHLYSPVFMRDQGQHSAIKKTD